MKPKMIEARVFLVDIANLPPNEVKSYMTKVKDELREEFDLTGVVFVPVCGRECATGWQ